MGVNRKPSFLAAWAVIKLIWEPLSHKPRIDFVVDLVFKTVATAVPRIGVDSTSSQSVFSATVVAEMAEAFFSILALFCFSLFSRSRR